MLRFICENTVTTRQRAYIQGTVHAIGVGRGYTGAIVPPLPHFRLNHHGPIKIQLISEKIVPSNILLAISSTPKVLLVTPKGHRKND